MNSISKEEFRTELAGNIYGSVNEFYIVALAAKLAEVDSPINLKEICSFSYIFGITNISDYSTKSLIIEASHDNTTLSHYAKRIAELLPEHKSSEEFVSKMFRFAASDAPINAQEITFLEEISSILGFQTDFVVQNLTPYITPQGKTPHDILGVSRKSDTTEIKKAYYKAVKAYHPDKLSCYSRSQKIIPLANKRISIITDAYNSIMK